MKVFFRFFTVLIFVIRFTQALAQQCTISGPGQVCAGEPAFFFANQPVDWSIDGMPVGNDGSQTLNYSFPNPFPTGSEPFTIVATTADGMFICNEVVTVLASPEISLIAVDENEQCDSDLSNVDFCLCEVEPKTLELSVNTPFATQVTNLTINWGDGTIEDITANINGTVSHLYSDLGLFDITVSAMGNFLAPCLIQTYQVFHGTDPIASLEDNGNNPTGCNVMIPFEIDTNNIEGTTYQIFILEGPLNNFESILDTTFTQENVIDNYIIDFSGFSSCQNGSEVPFWVNLVTINPCKRKEDVNGPFLISSPPTANFSSTPSETICVGSSVVFTNQSSGGFINGSSCDDDLIGTWTVSGSGTSVVDGDISTIDDIELLFEQPGTYIIGLEVFNDDDGVNGCSSTIYNDTLTVLPNGEVSATTNLPTANEPVCDLPFTLNAIETSDLEDGFIWTLFDDMGNEVATGDANNFEFIFTDNLAGSYTLELNNSAACNVMPLIIDFEISTLNPILVNQDSLTSCDSLTFVFDEVFEIYGNYSSAVLTINGETYDYPDDLATIPAIISPTSGDIILTVINECGTTIQTVPYSIEPGDNLDIDITLPMNVCITDGGTIDLNDFITPNDDITWLSNNAPDGIFDISQAVLGENTIGFSYGCANNPETIIITADTEIMLMDAVVCDDIIDITPDDFPYEGTCECNCPGIIDSANCTFDPAMVGVGNYEVTFTSNQANECGDNTAIAQITVEELTASLSASTMDACINDEIDFEIMPDLPNTIISWDFGDGETGSGNPISHDYDTPGTYEVVATISSTLTDCIISENTSITISGEPEPLYNLNIQAECEGSLIEATIIDPIPNTIYTLEISDGTFIDLTGGTGSIFILGEIEAIETIITLSTQSECGTTNINDTITISPIFNANFDVVGLDNDTNTFCGTDTISFGDISTGPIDSFVVYYDSWTNFSINEFEPQTYHNGSNNIEQHTVTLVLFSDECGTDTAEVIIDILPVDVEALFNVNDSIFCFGDTLIVNNLSTPGSDSYFNINDGSSTMTFGIGDTIVVADLSSGNYIVSVIAEGCGIDTTQLSITVGDMLSPQIIHDLIECTGNPAIFATDIVLNNMQWVSSDGQMSNDIMATFTYDTPGQYTIQLMGNSTQDGACEVYNESIITIVPMPELELTVSELSICLGDSISYTATTNAEDIIWIFSNGDTFSGTSITFIPDESGYLSATVVASTDGRCSVDTLIEPVVVEGNFDIDAGENVSISLGESTVLSATSSENLLFEWSPANTLSCVNCADPTARPLVDTWYTLTGTNINTCTAVDSVLIKVSEDANIYIPNIFSPNFDEQNDTFTIFGGAGVDNIKSLRIFDRWGELLFFKEDFSANDVDKGWDGTHRGKMMNIGIFVYTAQIRLIDGRIVEESGDVTLIR